MEMRIIIILILGVVLTFGCVPPPMTKTSHRICNEHGKYKGRVDSNGRIYDEHGRYEGVLK